MNKLNLCAELGAHTFPSILMSKKLTSEVKVKFIEASLPKLTDEQKKIVKRTASIDDQYTKLLRYVRINNKSKKQENDYLLDLATKYRHVLEGLDCIDRKLWTDEKEIKTFTDIIDAYCDKGVKLVEDIYRRHLERLRHQREQCRKEYEAEQAKYDKEIAELEEKLGDEIVTDTVVTEVSLIP